MTLDHLDQQAAAVFDGYLVRKDLVRKYSRQYPVPTYVVEFLLGRYCASTDEKEIAEGSQIVEKQLRDRTVRTGEEELFKARAKDSGSVKLIDIVKARLDAKNDCFLAELPSLALRDVRIDDQLVRDNERMLTDGFYAEVTLVRRHRAQEQGGRPFSIESLRPIQMSKSDVLDVLAPKGAPLVHDAGVDRLPDPLDRPRACSSFSERARSVSRSCGWSRSSSATTTSSSWAARHRQEPPLPADLAVRAPDLGRQGDRRQDVREQRERPARPRVPVRRRLLRRGVGRLLRPEGRRQHHEGLHGLGAVQPRQGEHPRRGCIVMVGNFDVDVEQQQRVGHLLSPLPPEMRNDTAFMDRLHAFVPGWDFPKLNPNDHFTDHFGLVSDFLSECWSKLRSGNRVSVMQGRVHLGGALSGRDIEAVNKTVSGLTKLLFPDPERRTRRGPRVDRARRARVAASREGAAEALLQERVPQHALQLHRRARRRGAVRLDARAAQRRGHRERSASAGPGLGSEPLEP
jgi:ATP-dependent Lon protease